MILSTIHWSAIRPALALLPEKMASPEAITELLAIGLQESGLIHRKQINGPARGLWQFERGGGVYGVLNHPASRKHAAELCRACGVASTTVAVYEALERDDTLAAGFARLLLWTDPHALPAVSDVDGGWALYLRTWRPGKPHLQRWAECHRRARAEVQACKV